jgi:hypothetical protein
LAWSFSLKRWFAFFSVKSVLIQHGYILETANAQRHAQAPINCDKYRQSDEHRNIHRRQVVNTQQRCAIDSAD